MITQQQQDLLHRIGTEIATVYPTFDPNSLSRSTTGSANNTQFLTTLEQTLSDWLKSNTTPSTSPTPSASPTLPQPSGSSSQPESGGTSIGELKPTFVTNGWGSGHVDRSNGEQNDSGNTLSIRGKTYDKGLGVHANSEVDVALNGKYSNFTSDIGVDDETSGGGSVDFQVVADGKQIYDSGVLTGTDPVKHVNLDVSGTQKLQLLVNPGADGIGRDHADWAGATLTTGSNGAPTDNGSSGKSPAIATGGSQPASSSSTPPKTTVTPSANSNSGSPQPTPTPASSGSSALDPGFHDSDPGAPNDAHPDGVPSSYSWYNSAAQTGWGNNPPSDWHSITGWGQIYAAEGWHPEQAPNTRVQVKDLETWVLSKSTGKWSEVQSAPTVGGAAFASDFGNNSSKGITPKDESNNGGGTSVTAGDGYNYHFWANRADMNPTDIAGVYSKFQARLVLDNPNGTDDRSKSHYIASAGADYWRSQSAGWAADWSNNGGVGGGRFKTVTDDWQNFSFETLPADQLAKNPPPTA